jgi:ATP-dependent exoDNAse (exonuclease V) beta subunit
LLAALIASWPDRPSARAGRTCFLVGDPMQSIYFFRDADAELFPRVRDLGLDIPPDLPLTFDFVPLRSNFRTAAPLVEHLNEVFTQVFAAPDGSGVTFTSAQPARDSESASDPRFHLHLQFAPQTSRGKSADPQSLREKEAAGKAQLEEIVALIRNLQQSNSPQEAAARSTPSTSPILHENPLPPPHPAGDKYRIAVLARARKSLAPIAQALREAAIPFRAVELEKLADRPEVLDALALARALLNPYDRVAWLGVLRAPWCGLSLDDLHILASADDPALLARPVPGLLAERLPLLSPDGRLAVQRLINTLNSTHSLRSSLPTTSPGTWLLQVWRNLGGAACVDATANANLDLLWSCLDRLPAGEQDLLGPALNAALDKLTALPDPNAGSDNGVQLMTIHKSKGLEFEVVIVPDLQAGSARGSRKLLSWLERGLATPDDSGEITEFLVAPLQSKGADRGKAKAWVDQVYRQRESQEDRRILYVAATRAREELHLFAQPAYKIETGGDLTLPNPSASLLATAWPALEEEVRARFEDWKSARISAAGAEDQIIDSLAASAETNLLLMPTLAKPTILHRLPPDYQPCAPSIPRTSAEWVGNDEPQPAPSSTHEEIPRAPSIPRSSAEWVGINEPQPAPYSFPEKNPGTPGLGSPGTGLRPWGGVPSPLEIGESTLYPRHQGNQLSRALGTAVHALLEQLARLRATNDWDVSRAALVLHEPRIAAQVRASGVDPTQAGSIAAQAIAIALDASRDPNCQWILSSHPGALSEVRWTGILNGALTSVRVDRVFRAGLNPQSEGNEAWWIVDYKTAHAENLDPAAAALQLRPLFTPQLEAYAEVLRNLHGPNTQIRAALYYPRMLLFDWWQI